MRMKPPGNEGAILNGERIPAGLYVPVADAEVEALERKGWVKDPESLSIADHIAELAEQSADTEEPQS